MNGACNCGHGNQASEGRVCTHISEAPSHAHFQRFEGVGWTYDLVCSACEQELRAGREVRLATVCCECFARAKTNGWWKGILGRPEIRIGTERVRFEHREINIPGLANLGIVDIQPIKNLGGEWLACSSTGSIVHINTDLASSQVVASLSSEDVDFEAGVLASNQEGWLKGSPYTFRVSVDGRRAVFANSYGRRGVVLDLDTGRVIMRVQRDDGHEDVSAFPLAWLDYNGRTLLVHGTEWNRVDVSDVETNALLTDRIPTSYLLGEPSPAHYLDYFHGGLLVSPSGRFIADNGWVWHPFGVIRTWSVDRWLGENVWESDDGGSVRDFCGREAYWDGPICWLDDSRLIVWGYGVDAKSLLSAALIFHVETGAQESWFPGPLGSLAFDAFLFSFSAEEGMSVWDVATGERIGCDPAFCPAGYHPSSKQFVTVLDSGTVKLSTVATLAG